MDLATMKDKTFHATLDEVLGPPLTKKRVRERIADWRRRLDDLYGDVSSWLPPDYETDRDRTTRMKEEMMTRSGVDPVELPVLTVRRSGKEIASLRPDALWVLGVNGQVTIRTPRGFFDAVDIAEPFKPPHWRIWRNLKSAPFEKSTFLPLLRRAPRRREGARKAACGSSGGGRILQGFSCCGGGKQ